MKQLTLLISVIIFLLTLISSTYAVGKCINGKDQTEWAKQMVGKMGFDDTKPVRLPRRLLGDVYLKRGFINGMDSVSLSQEPVLLICHNDTIGAIQLKLVVENVTFHYDWVYGDDESWGIAKTPAQRLYIDIDIEQSEESKKPVMLGMYITKITNTKFAVEVNGSKDRMSDAFDHRYQVALVTRTFIARDAGLAITMEISPKVTDYLFYNKLEVE
ncbi:uncharacterized protein LOC128385770 isoform X2 [Panonychus citri]|uniref:uncharacterized protein LOC128385770 isoform X2 n=1 Tax=Panonychus citri TaxID=50023 RepID=UPI002307ADB0|nr:uncharacterized protein LOC128385770 isoform X2 [Panonychus citri]